MGLSFKEPELWTIEVYIAGIGIYDPICSCNLDMTRWPSYTNLTRTSWRYTGCANMNFLRQGFRKLSSDRHINRHRQVTRGHFRSRDIRSVVVENPMLHANVSDGCIFYRTGVMAIEVYIAGIGIMDVFSSCDLNLDPMTFINELDPYCLEIYRKRKHELPTSRLSKVIV